MSVSSTVSKSSFVAEFAEALDGQRAGDHQAQYEQVQLQRGRAAGTQVGVSHSFGLENIRGKASRHPWGKLTSHRLNIHTTQLLFHQKKGQIKNNKRDRHDIVLNRSEFWSTERPRLAVCFAFLFFFFSFFFFVGKEIYFTKDSSVFSVTKRWLTRFEQPQLTLRLLTNLSKYYSYSSLNHAFKQECIGAAINDLPLWFFPVSFTSLHIYHNRPGYYCHFGS
ncbi:unnamed protein product [Ixodes pacificus]